MGRNNIMDIIGSSVFLLPRRNFELNKAILNKESCRIELIVQKHAITLQQK